MTITTDPNAGPVLAEDQPYDHFDPLVVQTPHAEWAKRRDGCPVSHSTAYDGFWFLARYVDVYATLVDTETFSSAEGAATPRQPIALIPEDVDPPLQKKYRRIINPHLTVQQVATFEPWVRGIARRLLDDIGDRTEFDLVEVFARPLPQLVTVRLVGIPEEATALVARCTGQMAEVAKDNPAAVAAGAAAGEELFGYLGGLLAERRGLPSRGDWISAILDGSVDGEPLSEMDQLCYVALLLFGGLHTTTGALAGALVWLGDHPEDRERLRADPGLYRTAVDEIVRFTSPSSHLGRNATRDVEIGGCPVPAGSRVMVGLGSANRDPEKFDRPDEIVLDRTPNHHVGFGMGPHRCVGSHLAKLMLRVGLEEFLARYDSFRAPDHSALRYAGGEARGLVSVPFRVGE